MIKNSALFDKFKLIANSIKNPEIENWKNLGLYATNKGSRVHYELEKYALKKLLFIQEPFIYDFLISLICDII